MSFIVGSTCGVYVVRGSATEIGFSRSGVDLLVPTSCCELNPGDITVSRDTDVHLVGNFSSSRSDLVTLHCFSPPLGNMKVYDQSETFLAEYEVVTQRAASSGCYHVQI